MQKSPERWADLANGEGDNLLDWCKERLVENEEVEEIPLPPGYIMKHGKLYVETIGRDDIPVWS
jgi:hypothetical protein